MSRRAFAASPLLLLLIVLAMGQGVFGQTPTPASASAVSKFVGTWQEDESKRKGVTATLTFRTNASGGLEEVRGSELRPLVQPVNFTGQPYAIDDSKNTIAWKKIDSNRFERAIYREGRLLNTRRLELSADGKTLTEVTEASQSGEGKTLVTAVFRRESGDQGLAGRWKAESFKSSAPLRMTYEAAGSNGIKLTVRGGNPTTTTAMLDNKPVPVVGEAVISGTMTAVRQVDESTLEFTASRQGTTTGKSVRVVSADGKTMTVTSTDLGPNASKEPSVTVFVKQ